MDTRRTEPELAQTGAGSAVSEEGGWLLLIYRVPSEPTRLRASVWRRLRKMGAVYVQNSVAVSPRTPQNERLLRVLRSEITDTMNGLALLVHSSSIVGETDLVALYNAARDDEYEEILDKCQDFHAEIDKEVAEKHFTYGELEENEEDLKKLRRWHEKVRVRDVLGASRGPAVVDAIEGCATRLEEFAAQVYHVDGKVH
ncbi:MAG: Chromate resistance protein ChrB [Microbacterium sp.]